jgi:LPXTG-motif cell wall-anchored protein
LNTRTIIPFLCGLIILPSFIVAHECGHALAALGFGLKTELHYALTTYHGTREQLTPTVNLLITTAGVLVGVVLMALGFVWLWKRRRDRRSEPATVLDWLATSLALNAGRWLRGFTGTPANPQPDDEAFISKALGLPSWLLPYCLALMALIVSVAIIRQHAPGLRLLPFSAIFLGGVIGCALWMRLLGPILLP